MRGVVDHEVQTRFGAELLVQDSEDGSAVALVDAIGHSNPIGCGSPGEEGGELRDRVGSDVEGQEPLPA